MSFIIFIFIYWNIYNNTIRHTYNYAAYYIYKNVNLLYYNYAITIIIHYWFIFNLWFIIETPTIFVVTHCLTSFIETFIIFTFISFIIFVLIYWNICNNNIVAVYNYATLYLQQCKWIISQIFYSLFPT